MDWFFRQMQRGEMNVDPIESEFFTTDAIEGLADALVRESIQNSLDAALPGAAAEVRFCWRKGAQALPTQKITAYFGGLETHLRAKGSGLLSVPNLSNAPVPVLLVEDFNTRGLRGDPDQEADIAGQKNDFYYFWRNIGRSTKQEKDRGRWGLGKTVFPASSQINTFFGVTSRTETPGTLLMGQSVLKIHEMNGKRVYPYGFYGDIELKDGFARPIASTSFIKAFEQDFGIGRTSQTGLSVVIPYPDDEITEQTVMRAVLKQYFYPLLSGSLRVTVVSAGKEIKIDHSTLLALISEDAKLQHELGPIVRLAEWASKTEILATAKEPAVEKAPRWDESALEEETVTKLRPLFENGERLGFKIPVYVKQRGGTPQLSFLKIFLERDLNMESHRPVFIRQGLIVTAASKAKLRGVRALVVIDDKALATMLGDAENPAHTEWQDRSGHFKEKYEHGPWTLTYIKSAPSALVQMLTRSDDSADVDALKDVFFLVQPPTPEEKRKAKDKKPQPGPDWVPPDPPQPAASKRLKVTQIAGGFTVQPASATFSAEKIRITTAYEVRRGNAFTKYQVADFEFPKAPIEIDPEHVEVLESEENCLVVAPSDPNFKVTIKGFDPSRDLRVRATVEE